MGADMPSPKPHLPPDWQGWQSVMDQHEDVGNVTTACLLYCTRPSKRPAQSSICCPVGPLLKVSARMVVYSQPGLTIG